MSFRESVAWDKVLPCLFTRLSGDNEAQANIMQYKRGVLNDLENLLNANAFFSPDERGFYDHVESSVLNYGITNFSGVSMSLDLAYRLEKEIRRAIVAYEPRINPDSLEVKAIMPDTRYGVNHHNIMHIEIRGELWLTPYPEALVLKTDLDLETGEFKLGEVS